MMPIQARHLPDVILSIRQTAKRGTERRHGETGLIFGPAGPIMNLIL